MDDAEGNRRAARKTLADNRRHLIELKKVELRAILGMNDESLPSDELLSIGLTMNDESDRGCALVGAALLDDTLLDTIRGACVEDEGAVRDFLGDEEGNVRAPVGDLGARALAAYCLGLISREVRAEIDLIRRIRNRFAHRRDELSFDVSPIRDWCSKLVLPLDGKQSNRDLYVASILGAIGYLRARRPQIPPKTAPMPSPDLVSDIRGAIRNVGHAEVMRIIRSDPPRDD